jgi:hypothetical protein
VGELIEVKETVLEDEGSDVDESVDSNVENIVLLTAAEPEGVLSKLEELACEDTDADTETLEDEDVEGEPDSVTVEVRVDDVSGDVEVDADRDAFHDGMASLLLEGIDIGEVIESEDIEGEPDNDASDEKKADEVGVVLSDINAVALIVGG